MIQGDKCNLKARVLFSGNMCTDMQVGDIVQLTRMELRGEHIATGYATAERSTWGSLRRE